MLEQIFPGDSEMAVRMRALDWSTTDLGSPESWPENLRIALSICLTSRFPMQVWWGPNLAMLYNDAYIPFLGTGKHPRALGHSARDIWPEIWHQIGPMLEQVVTTGVASWSEDIQMFFNRQTPKEEVFVSFSFSPIFAVRGGGGDKVEGVFCACTETTEKVLGARQLAARAQELAESEARYRSLFASAPMAVFVCDRNAVIQYFNARAAELWGREPTCGVEQHCGSVKLWLPDGTLLPHDHSPMVEVLRTGIPAHNVEVFSERPDGSRLPVLVNFAALKDVHGNVTGAITSFVDITERKRSEELLRESQESLTAALAASDTATFRWNPYTGEFLGLDENFKRLWGFAKDEPLRLAEDVVARLHPDDVAAVAAAIDACAKGADFDMEFRVVLPDGGIRWLSDRAKGVFDSDGKLSYVIGACTDITHRKVAEESLRSSEQQRRLALESAELGAWHVDPATMALTTDQRFRDIFGVTADSFGYEEAVAVIHTDDQARVRDAVAAAVQPDNPAPCAVEYRVIQPDGSVHWVFAKGRANVHGEGPGRRVSSFDGTVADITERKQTEALLSCQRQAFEMVARGAPLLEVLEFLARATESQSPPHALVAIHLLDESGTHFEQTAAPNLPPRYREAVDGMAVSSAAGSCCAAVASRRRVVVADIAACDEWPAFATFTLPLGLRAACSTPIFSSSGKVLGTFVTYYPEVREPEPTEESLGDIVTRTAAVVIERNRAEEALRQSEERFRMLAENMSQFAWTADAKGWIYWYNQRWYDYTGTTLEDMQGWGWTKAHHPDHIDRVVKHLQHSWDTGQVWEDTFPLRSKDGEYRWFLSRARPIRDAAGHIMRWFGTNTDVTEQLAAEDALKESDRRKNEFLAMLAHELRNPLAPIRNGLQIIRMRQGNGNAAQSASEMMERQIDHMVRLVDDLLDVSRISRGTIELRRERLELASIVGQAVETSRPAIERARHELTVTLPPQPVFLHADSVRLAQVFSNLLNNAAKYSGSGGRISLTADRQGNEVVVTVQDAGVGIPHDMLPRIFEMFAQVDRSLERSQGGLGIGLTLVKELVELHGGTVEAHSAGIGQGSTFVVRLPTMVETSASTPASTTTEPAATRALRILVVDDNLDSAECLAVLLQFRGHETHMAHDGLEAVEAAGRLQPDVVLLDIGLPRLNGYDAARRIREQQRDKRAVLVALTGWGQEEDRRRSKDAGFDAHMVKPVTDVALMKKLVELGVS